MQHVDGIDPLLAQELVVANVRRFDETKLRAPLRKQRSSTIEACRPGIERRVAVVHRPARRLGRIVVDAVLASRGEPLQDIEQLSRGKPKKKRMERLDGLNELRDLGVVAST